MLGQLKKIQKTLIIIFGIIIIIEILYLIFGQGKDSPMNTGLLLLGGLVIGALAVLVIWLLLRRRPSFGTQVATRESSHTVIESMKRVFKIVLVEGQFSDIYNFEETQKVLGLIPSTKKALVMSKATVMLGFDFNKCVWEADEENQVLRIIEFPEAEILSMDTDLKYYNMENGLFNKFDKDDYSTIQENIKKQIKEAVKQSDLPQMAQEQMSVLLQEVVDSKHWLLNSESKSLMLD